MNRTLYRDEWGRFGILILCEQFQSDFRSVKAVFWNTRNKTRLCRKILRCLFICVLYLISLPITMGLVPSYVAAFSAPWLSFDTFVYVMCDLVCSKPLIPDFVKLITDVCCVLGWVWKWSTWVLLIDIRLWTVCTRSWPGHSASGYHICASGFWLSIVLAAIYGTRWASFLDNIWLFKVN